MRKYIILLSISLVVFSCTIQKRTFRRGYHVEWNHKYHPTISETTVAEQQKGNDLPTVGELVMKRSFIEEDKMIEVAVEQMERPLPAAKEQTEHPDPMTVHAYYSDESRDTLVTAKSVNSEELLSKADRKTVEPVSWFALFFSLSCSTLEILIFLQIVDSIFIPLAAILFVLTIVFAIVSLVRYYKHKPQYYRPWLALAAIWIVAFVSAMLAFILVLQALGKALENMVAVFLKGG